MTDATRSANRVSTPKRFFPDPSKPSGMRESAYGDYVLMSDWVALLQRLEVYENRMRDVDPAMGGRP